MQASSIGSTTPVTQQHASTRGFNDLDSEDFFALLIAQLQAQDPMKPTDNQQLLSQMSGIRQMEQSSKLNTTLDSLAAEQRFGSTSGLIGHYIAGTVKDSAGQPQQIQGLVIGVRFEQGNAILELHNGKSIPAEAVEQVTLVENLPPDILAQLQHDLEELGIGGGTDTTGGTGTTGGTDPTDGGDTGDGGGDAGGKTIPGASKTKFHTPGNLDWGATPRATEKAQRLSLVETLMRPRFSSADDFDDRD
jgi:flagellar basal-body rod modification protein FlgD